MHILQNWMKKILFLCHTYNCCRAALVSLCADTPLLQHWHESQYCFAESKHPRINNTLTIMDMCLLTEPCHHQMMDYLSAWLHPIYQLIHLIFSSTGSLAESPGLEELLKQGGCVASAWNAVDGQLFWHESNTWGDCQSSSIPGAHAYAARKNAMWGHIATSV